MLHGILHDLMEDISEIKSSCKFYLKTKRETEKGMFGNRKWKARSYTIDIFGEKIHIFLHHLNFQYGQRTFPFQLQTSKIF
jgi:hypothetical protein